MRNLLRPVFWAVVLLGVARVAGQQPQPPVERPVPAVLKNYTTLAPLVANGVVMVGASGGEYGIRGFVAGFDVETGKEKWRTYTVPAG